jgi:hypothetical protein
MNIISKILGGTIAAPIDAISRLIDVSFVDDEERLSKQVLLDRIASQILLGQQEINGIEASHRSLFIAGWRPFLGWLCGLGYLYEIILRPIMLNFNINLIGLDKITIMSMTVSLLGLSAERTIEKIRKVTR